MAYYRFVAETQETQEIQEPIKCRYVMAPDSLWARVKAAAAIEHLKISEFICVVLDDRTK